MTNVLVLESSNFLSLVCGPYTRYYNVYFEVLSIVVMFLSRLAFKIHL